MGYDIHITRAAKWTESESMPILLEKWQAYVASSSEFQKVDCWEVTNPKGETIVVEDEGLAVWTACSGHDQGDSRVWFTYRRGRIVVKNAGAEIRSKMKSIAKLFDARVVGDEGEEY